MHFSKLNNDDPGFSKWHAALGLVGVAACSALIYYYFIKNKSIKKIEDNKTSKVPDVVDAKPKEDVELTPDSIAQQHKLTGNTHYKNGRYEEAIKSYNLAIEASPISSKMELSTYYQNRAAAYEQIKNWENVMSDCTKALGYNKKYVRALSRRAKACEVLDDLTQSLEDLTAVCILESFGNDSTLMNVDRILKKLGKEHAKIEMENKVPVNPSKHFIKTYFESFMEDPLIEKESVENGLLHNGEATDTPVNLNSFQKSREYLLDGKLDKVISCCSTEITNPLSEIRSSCLITRATAYILRGENKKAFADLDEIINMSDVSAKISVNALIKRGILYMQLEDVDKALEDLNKAAEVDPNNADIFHHKGQVLLLLSKVSEAIVDFKKAVELNSEYGVAVVQKCYSDFRYAMETQNKSKIEDIKKEFKAVIKRFPECTECYMLFAQVLSDLSEWDEANEVYDELEKVDPTNANILVYRGMLLLQSEGNMVKARELINKAIDLDETCQMAYEHLATIEVQLGNLKSGIELFTKAIKYAKTGMEMTHLCALRDAAIAQMKVVESMGIVLPNMGMA